MPEVPDARLNSLLADEPARKREELLKATEKDLDKIIAATQRTRKPLLGEDAIGLAVGQVIGDHKMKKQFDLTITEKSFSYARRQDNITAEAALDGVYVIRTCVSSERMNSDHVVLAYKSLAKVERAFRSLKSIDLHSGLSAAMVAPDSHFQVPASPEILPGWLLISIKKKPRSVNTSNSTSLMEPSEAMNSKLDQARCSSDAGNRSRMKLRASRSREKLDSVTVIELLLLFMSGRFRDRVSHFQNKRSIMMRCLAWLRNAIGFSHRFHLKPSLKTQLNWKILNSQSYDAFILQNLFAHGRICCRANTIHVQIDDAGTVQVWAEPEQEYE